MQKLTFTAFSDLHDNPGRFYTNASQRLQVICDAAVQNRSALLLHAGDFCHDFSVSREILQQYRDCPVPAYHTLGNHDCEIQSYNEVLKAYDMPGGYYHVDVNGFRFVFTDTNYYRKNGQYIHFSAGNHCEASKEERYCLPPDEMQWLEKTVSDSPYPCIVISHHSFDREVDSVKNRTEIREILYRAGKVMLCINGHHHRDHQQISDGICWLELNSASYNWLQKPHTFFPAEITEKYILSPYTAIYKDPLYAVITVSYDGTVEIKGIQSSFFMGVSRETSGNTALDECGRPARPCVTSAIIKGCNVGPAAESQHQRADKVL